MATDISGGTMRAAVYHGPRDIRIEDVAIPEPGPGQLVVEVSRNGICGSDLHTYVGGSTGGATMHLPGIVLGHEFAGTVRAIGTEDRSDQGSADRGRADGIRVGSTVAIAPIEWCGSCYACGRSMPNMCRKVGLYGGYRLPLHGGLARYVCVSQRSAFAVPEGLGANEAALAEPMAVATHAVRRAPNLLGCHVLVLGTGPIGLGVLMAARAAGATTVLDPRTDDVRGAVRDLTGSGVDVVFETTANDTALAQGISALRPRGTLVSVAGWSELARFDMGLAMAKELDVRFTITYEPAVDFPAPRDRTTDSTRSIPVRFDGSVRISLRGDRHRRGPNVLGVAQPPGSGDPEPAGDGRRP